MQDHLIYTLTPRGEAELRNSVTTLSADEIELLIRTDGALSLAQIKAGVPAISSAVFSAIINRLLEGRFLKIAEADPFGEQLQFQVNELALTQAGDEADSGTVSLLRTGYYVSIARKRATARALQTGEAFCALVVEDVPLLAKFVKSFLSMQGFKVRVASNRAEVVAELRKPPVPDLILLDVMLPDADGFDILLRLRQHPALKNVPVIMLTGMATREAVLKGLASGADGYITKPFEADSLMSAVKTVLGLRPDAAAANNPRGPWTNRDSTY